MSLLMRCPSCDGAFRVPEAAGLQVVACPHCQRPVRIGPAAAAPAEPGPRAEAAPPFWRRRPALIAGLGVCLAGLLAGFVALGAVLSPGTPAGVPAAPSPRAAAAKPPAVLPARAAAVKPPPAPAAPPAAAPVKVPAAPRGGAFIKAAEWSVQVGRLREGPSSLTVECDSHSFRIISREPLPEHFQLTIPCRVELPHPPGQQPPAARQEVALWLEFAGDRASPDAERRPYVVRFFPTRVDLTRGGNLLKAEFKDCPAGPFALTVTRRGPAVTVAVDDQIWLAHQDDVTTGGRFPLALEGTRSRLELGAVKVRALDPPPGAVAVAPKKPGPTRPKAEAGWRSHELPATVEDVVAGGAGRFLVLRLRGQAKLLVFHVPSAAVVGEVPLPHERVAFAAGLEKLFVSDDVAQVLRRYDLATQREELAVHPPVPGRMVRLATGAAARGPLACVVLPEPSRGKPPPFTLLDPTTLQPLALKLSGQLGFPVNENTFVAASADGKAFGVYPFSPSVPGFNTATLAGDRLRLNTVGRPPALLRVLPAPDGRTFFTPLGLHSPTGEVVAEAPGRAGPAAPAPARGGARYRLPGTSVGPPGTAVLVPAQDGAAYVAASFADKPGSPGSDRCRLALYVPGQSRAVLELPPVELPRELASDALRPERRIWLVPAARRLVVIPRGNDRLLWRDLDLDEAVAGAGFDGPVVTTLPPAEAVKGAEFTYAARARGGKGPVRFQLESGPKGMTVSPDGVVRWAVPRAAAENEVTAVLGLRPEGGGERFHGFALRLLDPPAAPRYWADLPAAAPEPAPGGADPLAVKPAALKKDREEYRLSSAVADVLAAGGGRFLILHQPREQRLAVFDTHAARVVGTVPLAEAGARFAAGREHLLVVLPGARLVQRWDLRTLQRDKSAPLPFKGTVELVAMGADSRGPLLLALSGGDPWGLKFLDVATLAPAAVRYPRADMTVERRWRFRATAGGDLFYMWALGSGSPPRLIRYTVRDGELRSTDFPLWGGEATEKFFAVPDAADRHIYAVSGRYRTWDRNSFPEPRGWPSSLQLPAVRGPYYFEVSARLGGPRQRHYTHFTLCREGTDRVDAVRGDLELPPLVYEPTPSPFPLTFDKRIWLIPEARLLVVVSPENDRLVLQRLDPEAEAGRDGVDYLRLTAPPPPPAVRGAAWRYALTGRSRRGGSQVRLESGYEGMDLTPEGVLTWDVPALAPDPVRVTVRLRDGTGQEVVERFDVPVRSPDAKRPAAPGPP